MTSITRDRALAANGSIASLVTDAADPGTVGPMSSTAPPRVAPLDSLRGLAALAVAVFSHYQHFGGDHARYPFAATAWGAWLYGNSWFLVDFFFLLSGMVLTLRYLRPLSEGAVGAREFFLLRLTRLYPLHAITLGVCAIVEWRLLAHKQPPLIYGNADLYHFFLNATYLQAGWFDYGWSYNGPSWSVSVEICAYALFFAFAAAHGGRKYLPRAVLGLLLGLAIARMNLSYPFFNQNVSRGLVGFFLGSLVWLGVEAARAARVGPNVGYACLLAFATIVGLSELIGYKEFVGITPLPHALVVFPLLVVACLEVPMLARVLSLRPLRFLGDLSYSVYMVHVPLQMVVLSVLGARRVPTERPWVFFAYAAAVVGLATLSHRFVELPLQRKLRARLLPVTS